MNAMSKSRILLTICACLALSLAAPTRCSGRVESFVVGKDTEREIVGEDIPLVESFVGGNNTEREIVEDNCVSHVPLKIACWVLTTKSSADVNKSKAIAEGWGKSCQALEFIDRDTPSIEADWENGYEKIAGKSYRAWLFMFHKYLLSGSKSRPEYDFILKADTDTFIVEKNLRLYLARFSPDVPHYIGKQLIVDKGTSIVAGATIILSRSALELLAEATHKATGPCSKVAFFSNSAEDVALATCMRDLGVYPINTRDKSGAERFMVLNPNTLANTNTTLPSWYTQMSFNKKSGEACCSEEAITFHFVTLEQQRDGVLEYISGLWQFRSRV